MYQTICVYSQRSDVMVEPADSNTSRDHQTVEVITDCCVHLTSHVLLTLVVCFNGLWNCLDIVLERLNAAFLLAITKYCFRERAT